MSDLASQAAQSVIGAATPLLLAATGELVVEKAGVLNLGVEGMMLIGAVAAFIVGHTTGSTVPALGAAILAGAALALLFAGLALGLRANQIVCGLALTIFGRGLSALVGAGYVGLSTPVLPRLSIPGISSVPLLGTVLLSLNGLVYFSLLALFAVSWFLRKTRWGLIVRAVGDSHDSAHAIGYAVLRIRLCAVLFGGAMAGLAGAMVSLSTNPFWTPDLTAGRGWVALALVVFAAWRPLWLLAGAYLFGAITYLSLALQALGVAFPPSLISALPYAGTIVVLVLISRDRRRIRLHRPAMLGKAMDL